MKDARSSAAAVLASVLVAAAMLPARATELRGRVVSVSGTEVAIRLDASGRPERGDAVRIGFEVPGVGFVPLEGTWTVASVGSDGLVSVRPGSGTQGVPKVQHVAIIESRAAATPAVEAAPRVPVEAPGTAARAPARIEPRPPGAEELYATGHRLLWGGDDAARFPAGLDALRRAAGQGHVEATFEVGVAFSEGRGVARDVAEAARWFEKAATAGHAKAQYNIGILHMQGTGVRRSDEAAVRWLRSAAEAGVPQAQAQLGLYYAEGRAVARDDAQAARWFRAGAEGGDPSAASNIGNMYRDGRGVAVDYREAMRWYQRALDLGHPRAALHIGFLYEGGLGVPPDRDQAIAWYRRAAAAGVREAQERLDALGAGR